MDRIEIGDITEENVKPVRRQCQTIFPVNYNDKFYRKLIGSGQLAKLAYFDGVLAGVVCCRLELADDGKHLYIVTLGCLFTYRRRGIGTAMLRHVIDYAAEKGVDDIYLHVQSSNTVAIQFYKKFGFEINGVVEDYYKNIEPSSALILKKVML
uniref:N-terminal methionine N(alpha)-acetyltransferase NatE n=1 Tax=Aceria tosichella TaxID=561515 RepID=A0A6G1S5B6_9ACAR